MKIGMSLTGDRIVIRDYAPEDVAFCTDMWFDPENGRYLSDPDREHVDEVFQSALDGLQDSESGYYLVVELRESGERMGTCCAFPEEGVYDIGYCIHKNWWRQGYGTELVELVASWVREQGGTAITAEAARENRASRVLLEKCGFQVVRESRFQKYHMDVWFDSLIYRKVLK
ncbi:MAG: GNAT family N-acetyltransferase [Oscillospiraceae bacterium]|nr:GNAT family N-acetyltransferase [Oscillospiraceae bacterium]